MAKISIYSIISNNDLTSKVSENTTPTLSSLELKEATPFIDFHYNNSTYDYTSRIIESSSGLLEITGNLKIDGTFINTPAIYSKKENVSTTGNSWQYIGTGVTVPAGSYIIAYHVGFPSPTNFELMGRSYNDYTSFRQPSGTYIDAITVTTQTTLKPCVYSLTSGTISDINVYTVAVRIG